jgi:hypothetical protein
VSAISGKGASPRGGILARYALKAVDWDEHADRERSRYEDGLARLPADPDARQKQLVRVAMAATGAGLARLMQGRRAAAETWLVRSAERFRESFADAPAESWGRLLGAVKARVLAGDREGAEEDARWALAAGPGDAASPIGRYAAVLALLVLGRDEEAAPLARGLEREPEEAFPPATAAALTALADGDAAAYARAAAAVLESFEGRDAYLEDVPVADTVAVLEALAGRRGMAAGLRSRLLPD